MLRRRHVSSFKHRQFLSERESRIKREIEADVKDLCSLGERNYKRYEGLQKAAKFIENRFTGLGYNTFSQLYPIGGELIAGEREWRYKIGWELFEVAELPFYNIIAQKIGEERPGEIVVVGAHYDSCAEIFPFYEGSGVGADDNASGVAAMLALASMFSNKKTRRTLRFLGFTNEEPPFFQKDKPSLEMGSLVYAKTCWERKENIKAMLSLEMLGYYSDEGGSQNYPSLLGFLKWVYGSKGNFVAAVGNLKSAGLVRNAVKSFRRNVDFPIKGVALPAFVSGVELSDHWSFWHFGYPGIMFTDTTFLRNPYYHTNEDTLEKLDYNKMSKVVVGLEGVVRDLVGVIP